MPNTQTNDLLLDCTLEVVSEAYAKDDLLDAELEYTKQQNQDIDIDATLDIASENYIGDIDSTLTVGSNRYNVGKFILDCSIKVLQPYDPLQYQGYITAFMDLAKDISTTYLPADVSIFGTDIHKDFLCSFSTRLLEWDEDIYGYTYLKKPDDTVYDLLDASMEYFDRENLFEDIQCSLVVPEQILMEFDATTALKRESIRYDILMGSSIMDQSSLGEDIVHGTVYVFPDPVNDVIIDAGMRYEKNDSVTDLDSFMYLETSLSRVEIPCQIKVKSRKFIYSLYTHMRVVPGVNKDIPCTLTVFNDQIWDIAGNLDIGLERVDHDLFPQVDLELMPYEVHDIDATVNIERVDTRKEVVLSMFVVDPINTDIECTMEVFTPYTYLLEDIPCSLNVGNQEFVDILDMMINVEGALTINNEITCRLEVLNELMPARVGIFVDPLWEYDPYVLKSSIATFLDRISTKNELKVIFGGNPRSNWDIQHFCDIFRVRRENQLEVLMDFCPSLPMANQEAMHRFIQAMCTFTKEEYEDHPYIDKVFIFTDMPHTHRSTMLVPLLEFCYMYRIPATCITSSGDFIDTTLATQTGYNRVEYFDPTKKHMYWFWGDHGEFSKHRSIFNTDSITIPRKD